MEAAEIIEKFPERSPIFMLSMKRRVYWTAQIVFVGFLGFFLYLGYNQIFLNNYLLLVPLFLGLGKVDLLIEYLIILSVKYFLMKEILLLCPLLFMFEFVQTMNMFCSNSFAKFLTFWLYRLAWNFFFRAFVDPIVFNLQKFQLKIYAWISAKAKNDEFYDKFLKYFAPREK